MLSLERAKKILNDPGLSDKEIEEIRDEFHLLAEIIFEKWKKENKKRPLYLKDRKRYCDNNGSL